MTPVTSVFFAEAAAKCCGPMRASSVAKTSPVARRSGALSIVHPDVATVSSSVHVEGVTSGSAAVGVHDSKLSARVWTRQRRLCCVSAM